MKPQRILINASPLTNHYQNRGVGNYTYSLLRELFKSEEYKWAVMAFGEKGEFERKLGISKTKTNFEFYSLGKPGTLLEKLSARGFYLSKLRPLVRKVSPDLILNLQFEHALVPMTIKGERVSVVTVIHDLIPLKTDHFSQKSKLANNIKKRNYLYSLSKARESDMVVTLSEYSRKDILSEGFYSEQVKAIPLAPPKKYLVEVKKQKEDLENTGSKRRTLNMYNITEPFVFYLGGLEKNKNVEQLVRSFALLVDKYPDLKLVIGGGEFKLGWDNKATPLNERAYRLMELTNQLKIHHKVIFTGFIDVKHLPIIYKYAECFVHLSMYEGFGLNVLEPQVVGTPVVAANKTTYPEVLGESALLVDPANAEKVAAAIEKLITENTENDKFRSDLVSKGYENANRYSWANTAEKTLGVLGDVLKTKKDQLKFEMSEKTDNLARVMKQKVGKHVGAGRKGGDTTQGSEGLENQGIHQKPGKSAEIQKTEKSAKIKKTEKSAKIKNSDKTTKIQESEKSRKSEKSSKPEKFRKHENSTKQKTAVVLATYFHPFKGGMEQVALDYGKFLLEKGYRVVVLTSDRKKGLIVKKKQEKYQGLQIVRLRRQGKNYYFNFLKGLYKHLCKIDPDIVHAHGFGFLGHDLALLRFRLKRRLQRGLKNKLQRGLKNKLQRGGQKLVVINTPHGPFMSKPESGLRAVIKWVGTFIQGLYLPRLLDAVIADNREQHKWINKKYNVKNTKIYFCPPVMPEVPKNIEQIVKKKRGKNTINITSISRLTEYKGFADLVTAFNEINSASSTQLNIAGADSDYTKKLRKIVSLSPRKDDIKFEVDISDKRRDEILENTDVFVLASSWEAFGIVIAEAMAYGAAVISTNTEGGRFLVREGKNGYLFKYKDLRQLINYLNKLVTNKKLLRELQDNSLEYVQEFNEEKVKTRYNNLIDSLVD